jgi:hypothetical protein
VVVRSCGDMGEQAARLDESTLDEGRCCQLREWGVLSSACTYCALAAITKLAALPRLCNCKTHTILGGFFACMPYRVLVIRHTA